MLNPCSSILFVACVMSLSVLFYLSLFDLHMMFGLVLLILCACVYYFVYCCKSFFLSVCLSVFVFFAYLFLFFAFLIFLHSCFQLCGLLFIFNSYLFGHVVFGLIFNLWFCPTWYLLTDFALENQQNYFKIIWQTVHLNESKRQSHDMLPKVCMV